MQGCMWCGRGRVFTLFLLYLTGDLIHLSSSSTTQESVTGVLSDVSTTVSLTASLDPSHASFVTKAPGDTGDTGNTGDTGHQNPTNGTLNGPHDQNTGSTSPRDSNTQHHGPGSTNNASKGHSDLGGHSQGHSDDSEGHGGHGPAFERYPVAYLKWHHVMYPYIALLWIIIACVARLALEYNPALTEFIPEGCYMVILGVIIGICTWFSGIETKSLSSEHFFIYLLPPVIIEAGYFMPKRAFFDQIGTILWYAIVSTLFATFSIAFSLWGFSKSGGLGVIDLELDMIHCMTYGGLIAAVDPVAVLATFEEIHVNEILHSVVFGESMLNDGVTVVLFNLFNGFSSIGGENITAQDIGSGIGSLFVVGIGGTLIGIFVGLIGAFVVRFTEKAPLVQPIIILTFGYLTYLTPELFNLSAILGCTFGCITLNKYGEPNLSKKSHTTVKYFLKMVAAVCETIIFMFLGTYVVNNIHEWNTAFILLNLIFCLAWRSVAILILTFIANRFRNNRLNFMDQFIMAYGGIRGGIAFALAASMDAKIFPQKKLFMTATIFVIYYTIFVMGITIKPLVRFLKVKIADKHKPSMAEKIGARVIDHLMSGVEDIGGLHGHNDLRLKYKQFDDKFMKPLLIRTTARKLHGSILNVYQKLLEKDAMDYIAKNQSFVSQSIPTSDSLTHLVRSHSSSQLIGRRSSGSVPIGEGSSVLDMRVLDVEEGDKTSYDVELHHILSENMFRRRRKNAPQRRLMVGTSSDNQEHDLIRHKARLHLRTLMKERPSGMRKRHSNMKNTGKKHDKKHKPQQSEDRHKHEDDKFSISSESDGGIIFYVPQNEDESETKADEENEPPESKSTEEETSATQTLPWRRETGQEPESSHMAHLVLEDQDVPQKSGEGGLVESAQGVGISNGSGASALATSQTSVQRSCSNNTDITAFTDSANSRKPLSSKDSSRGEEPRVFPGKYDETEDMPDEPDFDKFSTVCSLGESETGGDCSLPPPWRSIPSIPEGGPPVRSPSASFEMDSLQPHPSNHSIRLSEAESRHSEPYPCMHHVIEVPHCRPSECELLPFGTRIELDLEEEDLDCWERVQRWLDGNEEYMRGHSEHPESPFLDDHSHALAVAAADRILDLHGLDIHHDIRVNKQTLRRHASHDILPHRGSHDALVRHGSPPITYHHHMHHPDWHPAVPSHTLYQRQMSVASSLGGISSRSPSHEDHNDHFPVSASPPLHKHCLHLHRDKGHHEICKVHTKYDNELS